MAMAFPCSSDEQEAIELPDAEKTAFAESMFATMDASDGVGLAAPQVGVSERLFVIDSRAMIDEESDEQGIRKAFLIQKFSKKVGSMWAMKKDV